MGAGRPGGEADAMILRPGFAHSTVSHLTRDVQPRDVSHDHLQKARFTVGAP